MNEAYCGPAPTPASLIWAWNPDPVAIGLCIVLLAHHFLYRKDGRVALACGVGVLVVLFVSPLCALTVALFSARAAHHVLLVAVAAPLLALAFPVSGRGRAQPSLAWLAGIHAAVLWFWHVPEVYAFAIFGALPYWLMQASLLGTAFLLWRRIFASDGNAGAAMLALLATVVQMGMLGALLTFAQKPLYQPHFMTTAPFGLSPLDDQQLGGLVMWVPAALPYLAAALLLFAGRIGRQAGATPR